jgi:hypothetical protein
VCGELAAPARGRTLRRRPPVTMTGRCTCRAKSCLSNQAIFFDTNPVPLKSMLSRAGCGTAEVRPPRRRWTARLARRSTRYWRSRRVTRSLAPKCRRFRAGHESGLIAGPQTPARRPNAPATVRLFLAEPMRGCSVRVDSSHPGRSGSHDRQALPLVTFGRSTVAAQLPRRLRASADFEPGSAVQTVIASPGSADSSRRL